MRYTPVGIAAVLLLACSPTSEAPPPTEEAQNRGLEPPVATNAAPPVTYPLRLYEERVEGTVILRLFADERGIVVAESTQIAEGSGFLELDSAALAGVPRMTFAPARRNGQPVATAFLQPVQFRHPERSPDGARP